MANYAATQYQDKQVNELKRSLEEWRLVLLTLRSVILWEKRWHPAAIFGAVTLLHFLVWIVDLNSLATLAVICLLLTFIDFIAPVVNNLVYGPSAWTDQHEKVFIEICNNIVVTYNETYQNILAYYSLRKTSPPKYYIITIGMLWILTWIALSINGIFLFYVITAVMLLWPGFTRTLSLFKSASKLPITKSD